MSVCKFLRAESDCIVGKRKRLERFLVCSTQGFFPVLASGTVQLTFGRRIRPMGCGVLFSRDGGKTWDTDHEALLAGDGIHNADLGYPSTVQLADGTIVTFLYYASGSATGWEWGGWGDVSCQAIRYREADVR